MFKSLLFFIAFSFFINDIHIDKYELIKDGKGYKNIVVNDTTFAGARKILGNPDFKFIRERDIYANTGGMGYSGKSYWQTLTLYENIYEYRKLGIELVSFAEYVPDRMLRQKEIDIEVGEIVFKYPFKGITKKGIVLNKSTLGDVLKKYGNDLNKLVFRDFAIEYESEGIKFHFDFKKITHHNVHQLHHLKVIAITVSE